MRLGGLFPSSKGLADTVKKAAPIKAAASSLVTAIVNTVKKKPGEFDIKWPRMRTQKVKDYQVITTVAELRTYIARCVETGIGGFDYEAGPSAKIRAKYEPRISAMESSLAELEEEIETALASTEDDKNKTVKGLRAKVKTLETQLKATKKEYDRSPLDPHRAAICALSLSAAPDEARAIFISNKPGKRSFEASISDRDEVRRLVFDILEEEFFHSPKIMKIAVNLQYEATQTVALGKYILPPVADPFLMWVRCLQVVAPHKINPDVPYEGKGLKPMTKEYHGVVMQDFKALLAEFKVNFFDEISADQPKALSYCCEDSDYAVQHYMYWLEIARQIPGYDYWLHNIEMPFARVIGLMEYNGMAWDSNLAEVKEQEAAIMQEQASDEIKRIVKEATGLDINTGKTGKTNEVKSVIFDVMKLKAAKWSKTTGDPSLDEEALIDMRFMLENKLEAITEEKYLAVPLPDGWEALDPDTDPELSKDERMAIRVKRREWHPYKDAAIALIEQLHKIQQYSTLLSSHIIGRAKYVHEETGRIHAKYSQWTETSRLNSYSPNGQNVPAMHNDVFKIRNFYIPATGKVLFFIDFSGFELRLMAWKSGDEVMTEIFNSSDPDLHRRTAVEITGKAAKEVTKQERNDAKPANFGIAYGGTEHALQKTVKTDYGKRWTLDHCANIVASVKRAYKRIPEYQRDIVILAREQGWVSTIYGYIRLLHNINSPNKNARGSDERRAGNTPIQGTAADIMKNCQNQVYDEIGRGTLARRLDPKAEIILAHGVTDMEAQIHDEIIFEMDDDVNVVKKAGLWVKSIMEMPPLPEFPVKIEAEASVGYRWGEKEKLQEWIVKKSN